MSQFIRSMVYVGLLGALSGCSGAADLGTPEGAHEGALAGARKVELEVRGLYDLRDFEPTAQQDDYAARFHQATTADGTVHISTILPVLREKELGQDLQAEITPKPFPTDRGFLPYVRTADGTWRAITVPGCLAIASWESLRTVRAGTDVEVVASTCVVETDGVRELKTIPLRAGAFAQLGLSTESLNEIGFAPIMLDETEGWFTLPMWGSSI